MHFPVLFGHLKMVGSHQNFTFGILLSLTRFFQKFNRGDSVSVTRELGVQSPGFPKRMQGRTGRVLEKRGRAYVVEIKDYNMKKRYTISPIHLKKLKIAREANDN